MHVPLKQFSSDRRATKKGSQKKWFSLNFVCAYCDSFFSFLIIENESEFFGGPQCAKQESEREKKSEIM